MAKSDRSGGPRTEVVAAERAELLLLCGLSGLVGTLFPIAAIVAAVAVTDHDLIADTISDLARGPHKWIMDTGFYVNAAGLLGLAIGAAHVHLGRAAWSCGVLCLAFLALVVVLLGLWDAFHTEGQNPPGMTVHTWLTFLLGPLYLAGPLLMAKGAARVSRVHARLFVASAAIWILFAVPYLLVPTGIDGILEKIAIGATMIWTLSLSVLFLNRGRRTLRGVSAPDTG